MQTAASRREAALCANACMNNGRVLPQAVPQTHAPAQTRPGGRRQVRLRPHRGREHSSKAES